MKMYLLFLPALLTVSSSVFAQLSNRTTDWYPGIVILNDKEIVKGEISYDYSHDIVMCKEGEVIQTFTPHQVHSFKYFDEEHNIFHEYLTLSNEINPKYQQKAFYEVVLEGDVNFVRKRNRYPAYNAKEGYLSTRNARLNEHKVCYEYFIEYNDELIKSRRFKQEVLPLLKRNDQSLRVYMKENHLKPHNIGDQIELVEYYNHISSLSKPTASHNWEKHNQYIMVVD